MATVVQTPILRSRQGASLSSGIQQLISGIQLFNQSRQRRKEFEAVSNLTRQLQGGQGGQAPSTSQQIDLINQILPKLRNQQNITKVTTMADILNQRANRESRERVAGVRAGAKATPSPFSKINPKDFTAKSLTKFTQTGDVASLVPRKPSSSFSEKVTALEPFVGGREAAVKLATGVITTATDPFSKELKIVDLSNKEIGKRTSEVTIDTSGLTKLSKQKLAKVTEEASKVTLWELSELSTGPKSAIFNFYNKTFALTGLPVAKKTEVARTHLALAGITVTNALSNNSRYPEGLRKWILRQTNVQPSFFKTPELARQDYIALNSFVKTKIASEINFLQTAVSPVARQESLLAIKALEGFRVKLGVPENAGIEDAEIQRNVEADGTVIIKLPDGTYKVEEAR